jgi:hypothetical protein
MSKWWRMVAFVLGVTALGHCAPVNYAALPEGEFSGSLFVMWVGEGGAQGDGKFVFVPNPDAPLVFRRKGAMPSVPEVRPGLMYTDGGSIPKAAQLFKGFSPWGYAPAYMVHDWLFVARHCIRDGKATEAQKALAAVDFADSAAILGEAIRTLVAERRVDPNDLAGAVITGTVNGPISRAIWDRPGQCDKRAVSDAHRAEVERAFPGRSKARLRDALDAPEGFTAPARGPRARIVAEFTF